MMNRIPKIVIFISLLLRGIGCAQTDSHNGVPQRIVLNLTSSPATGIAVTWRTSDGFSNSEVQYSESTPWTEFEKTVSRVNAKTERFEVDSNQFVFHHSAVLSGLKPNTQYVYRVGHGSVWSEWNQFKTADNENAPFKFVFFGDPQNDIKEHVSRIFREAYKISPDADFWLFSGDLVKETKDALWGEFFDAAGFILRVTPSVMTPGNHDQVSVSIDGKKSKTTPAIWKVHFTLPENGITGLKETSYFFDYQGVRFVMMNTNERLQEQAGWLDSLLSNNPNRWTVVSSHYPLYNTGSDHDNRTTREAFLPIIDKHAVDLVLQGHDHTYARTYKLRGGKAVAGDEKGTVTVLSVSGPKSYEVNPFYKDIMAKMGTKVQLFQVISIAGDTLVFRAYTATGSVYDSFELMKK